MKAATEHPAPSAANDTARNARLMAIMLEALERPPSQRQSYVRTVCTDARLGDEVMELIDAHDSAGDFMAEPDAAPAQASPDSTTAFEDVGSRIGRYELVTLIGEGGFGRVYAAQQREPIARQVALKVIKVGMDTRQVIARFEAERQALAMMDHPGIARVIDAGATEAGRPYFVMELVDGSTIIDCCQQRDLSLTDRLDLFSQVCSAVQHAHMKGIIHRDLKPSNVLVQERDGRLLPKVIDFGIAKATAAPLTDRTLVTECRQLIGTPQYMSPEQADPAATDIDTRSDVYSLGVMFYELLTGATPFDAERLRSSTLEQVQRILREEDPPRPSARVSSLQTALTGKGRGPIEQRRLASRLRGDLDRIALKALEKDRERRYNSPAELAEDIRRHLHDEPVLASPPGFAYRARKLVRRHRGKVIAATVVALALIGGTVGTFIGMVQARQSAEQASAISDFMSQILSSVEPNQQGADVRFAEVLDDASSAASERFAGQREQEARVRMILGNAYARLGQLAQAQAEYAAAVELLQHSVPPGDRRLFRARLEYVNMLVNQNRVRAAEEEILALMPVVQGALGVDDEMSLETEVVLANVRYQLGRPDEAEASLRRIRERATAINASDRIHIRVLNDLVFVLTPKLGSDNAENLRTCAEIESLAREMVERSTRQEDATAMITLKARITVANMMRRRGDPQGAANICEDILAATADRWGPCHFQTIMAQNVLAWAKHRLGDSAAAADISLGMIECLRARNDDTIRLLAHMRDALPFLDQGGRWAEGEALARELSATLRGLGGGHDSMLFDSDLQVARFVSLQGRLEEAEQMFQSLQARLVEVAGNNLTLARFHAFHAGNMTRQQQFEDAERELHTALQTLGDGSWGTCRVNPDDVLLELIALYEAWNKPDEVEKYQRIREHVLATSIS